MQPNVSGKKIVSLHLWVFVWKREPKRKAHDSSTPSAMLSTRELQKQSRRKNRRNKVIKIRVFKSDKDGSKGKRIAELKKKIQGSRYQTIALPISLVKSMSKNDNSTSLHIRVECSRCNRKTRLVLPGNDKKRCRKRRRSRRRKNKSSRRSLLRKRRRNCAKARSLEGDKKNPFIIFEEKVEPKLPRFKRSSEPREKCTSQSERSPEMPTFRLGTGKNSSTSTASCCQKLETYISFRDLNLENEIVSPSGFHYVTCSSTCTPDNKNRRELQNFHRDFIRNEILKINSDSTHLQSFIPQPKTPIQAKISQFVKKSRLKDGPIFASSTCLPVKKQGLKLLYFNPDFSIGQSELPDFLVSECQCNSS